MSWRARILEPLIRRVAQPPFSARKDPPPIANPPRPRGAANARFGAWLGAVAALGSACQAPPASITASRLVDLSHAYDAETLYWPTEEGFVLEVESAGITEKGYYYAANKFRSAEHGGTHLDAPIHFARGQWTVDEIPLEKLTGPAIVVDVTDACDADPDYEIRIDDFTAWEARHGPIPRGTIVLLRTGFGQRWPDRRAYLGTNRRGPEAVAELHFPGLAPEAARWLVRERAINAIGLDTPSIDHGQSTLFESHRALFAANVPAFENLAQLDELPPRGFEVIALPMKIRGGTGAPLRIVAVVPFDEEH